MALVGEVGELVEIFQWLTEAESRHLAGDRETKAKEELADVQIYLVMIAEKLGIDLLSAVEDKITQNEAKYPVDKAKGTSKKYTDL
jgi:NTP pyrophosphatase (non-canonical NTP hydrolase)